MQLPRSARAHGAERHFTSFGSDSRPGCGGLESANRLPGSSERLSGTQYPGRWNHICRRGCVMGRPWSLGRHVVIASGPNFRPAQLHASATSATYAPIKPLPARQPREAQVDGEGDKQFTRKRNIQKVKKGYLVVFIPFTVINSLCNAVLFGRGTRGGIISLISCQHSAPPPRSSS